MLETRVFTGSGAGAAALTIGFDPDTYTYAESSGSAELTIRLFGATEVPVTVFFSTQDGSASSVTIGSGLFPGVYKLPETFLGQLAVSGSGVTLGVSQATATINDMNIFSDLNSHIACA